MAVNSHVSLEYEQVNQSVIGPVLGLRLICLQRSTFSQHSVTSDWYQKIYPKILTLRLNVCVQKTGGNAVIEEYDHTKQLFSAASLLGDYSRMIGSIVQAKLVKSNQKGPPPARGMAKTHSIKKSPLRFSLDISQHVLMCINAHRRLCGSAALQWSHILLEAATCHNIEMGYDGKTSASEFEFGAPYSEMIMKIIADNHQNFLLEKRITWKIGKNLMKLWTTRPSWLELMLDPLSKFCAIAVSINETEVYCTALFSVHDAYSFPLMIEKEPHNCESERMVHKSIKHNQRDMDREFSFHGPRRMQYELKRPYPTQPVLYKDVLLACRSFCTRCFPSNELVELNEYDLNLSDSEA